MKNNEKRTRIFCYASYVTQAIVVNLVSLYFVIFRETYGLSTGQLSFLVLANFVTQFFTDIFAIFLSTRIGLKRCGIAAHAFCAVGLAMLATLPRLTLTPYGWLLGATVVYSIGGGLLETTINPIFATIPAPTEEKGGVGMAFMHSFYCWGQMGVILVTTLLLVAFGEDSWWVLALLWALMPLANILLLSTVKVREPSEETLPSQETESAVGSPAGEAAAGSAHSAGGMKKLLTSGGYLLCLAMIAMAGAAEQSMAQWSSYFAEKGLSCNKMVGDLLGPCLFAFFMGLGRMLMGVYGKRFSLKKMIGLSSLLCVVCYVLTALLPVPFLSLAFCALTGFSVAILWPTLLDMAGHRFGATPVVFGLMSLFGDVGCSLGPTVTGKVTAWLEGSSLAASLADRCSMTAEQVAIRGGLLMAAFFPLLLILGAALFREKQQRQKRQEPKRDKKDKKEA